MPLYASTTRVRPMPYFKNCINRWNTIQKALIMNFLAWNGTKALCFTPVVKINSGPFSTFFRSSPLCQCPKPHSKSGRQLLRGVSTNRGYNSCTRPVLPPPVQPPAESSTRPALLQYPPELSKCLHAE